MAGLEPATPRIRGELSKTIWVTPCYFIGVVGFEPTTSRIQTEHADQTALHSVILADRAGFEPAADFRQEINSLPPATTRVPTNI